MKAMESNSQVIVGLDVGTGNIKVVAGVVNDGQISIVGVSESPTSGMRKGVVSDMTSLSKSIDEALGQVEKATGYEIDTATMNIDGSSIISTKTDGMIAVAGQEISADDLHRLEELATIGKIPDNRIILKVIPHDYILDGQSGIKDPLGMTGSRLEIKANVISTLAPHLDGLRKVASLAEVEPSQVVVSAEAAARAVLTEKQRENGVMLLEMGAATTGIAIYEGGDLQYLAVLPVGANNVTNDLALGLQIDPELAEVVKLTRASAVFSGKTKKVSVKHGKQIYEFDQADIDEIVNMRLKEIFEMIDAKLHESGYAGKLPSGVVLTGGGAKLAGIDNYSKNALGLVTHIANCQHQFRGLSDKINDSAYMTAVGLMLYDLEAYHTGRTTEPKHSGGLFSGLKKLFKK